MNERYFSKGKHIKKCLNNIKHIVKKYVIVSHQNIEKNLILEIDSNLITACFDN